MIRVGVVNIDTSHPNAFAQKMIDDGRARYVAIYNDGFRGDDEVNGFMEKFGLEKHCKTVEELAEMVDIGFIQGCNWDTHLNYVDPFIKLGKPVFIDKPIVGNVADCRKLIELERKGAIILGSSSVRYCNEVRQYLSLPEEKKGKVLHIDITVGVDEFNYAVHAVEAMCALAETRPVSVRYVGTAHREGQSCETFFVEFEGGVTACYHCVAGNYVSFNVIVLTTVDSYCFTIDNDALYKALLDQICNRLEGKPHCLAGIEDLTDSIKVLLAGKCSRESAGAMVGIDSPALETVRFDGDAFEKEYAANARPMYL